MGRKKGSIKLTIWHQGGYRDKNGRHYTETEAKKLFAEGMAFESQWKSRKNPFPMPGPGRKKKIPNLKRVEGGFQNQHGVVFTAEQKKALENSVRRSNYVRDKQIKEEDAMVSASGRSNAQLKLMGKESDFIIARQSRSLQGFKSMEEYEAFMEKQARIQSGEHLRDRTELYRANHIKSLENVFGDDAKDVIEHIRNMDLKEYREMLQKDEFLEVNYVYDPSALAGKLNQIRKSLKMADKEIPM